MYQSTFYKEEIIHDNGGREEENTGGDRQARPVRRSCILISFRNDKKAIQLILKCILGVRRGLKVESVSVQETVKSLDSHSVRFGILARGQDGTLFDVEIQKTNKKDLPKRASFYMSVLTNSNLEAGKENYDELRDRYVIFICDRDVAKRGEPLYTFTYRMKDGTPLEDGSTISSPMPHTVAMLI